MEGEKLGVQITLREIYDTLQTVGTDVKSIQSRMSTIDEHEREIHRLKEDMNNVEDMAKSAFELASRHEGNISWLWRTVLGTALTAIIGGLITAFFVVVQNSIADDDKSHKKESGVEEHRSDVQPSEKAFNNLLVMEEK